MKARILTLLMATAVLPVFAQDCRSIVALDQTGKINPAPITPAAAKLVDQGADVHVLVFAGNPGPLGQAVGKVEASCDSWRESGFRKPNLFLVAVAPDARTKNIFFGSAYAKPFENVDTVNTIYSEAANPFFRAGDYTGGVSAALRDFGNKVVAYHDQVKHPVQAVTTINNEATDFSGLWSFLKVAGIGVIVIALAALLVLWWRKKQEHEEERMEMRQDALNLRSAATREFNKLPETARNYASILAQYTSYSNSVSSDPSPSDCTLADYSSMRKQWSDLLENIRESARPLWNPTETPKRAVPRKPHTTDHTAWQGSSYAVPVSNTSSTTTVIESDRSSDLLTGVMVGEAISSHHDYDSYEHARSYTPSPSPSVSSGSD